MQPNLAATLLGFIPFGYSSPLHEAQAQFSDNYDFSYEHHFKGTDVAMKLTPYFRWATDQLYETVNLPSLGVSPSFNAGTERVDGIELLLTKGDFTKNGFSGTFSYTYTNAAEKWNNYPNSTVGPVDQYNQDIEEFNALTKAGGGAPCYTNDRTGTPAPCRTTAIRNPYYECCLSRRWTRTAGTRPAWIFPTSRQTRSRSCSIIVTANSRLRRPCRSTRARPTERRPTS